MISQKIPQTFDEHFSGIYNLYYGAITFLFPGFTQYVLYNSHGFIQCFKYYRVRYTESS
jgi:hypothetical protein